MTFGYRLEVFDNEGPSAHNVHAVTEPVQYRVGKIAAESLRRAGYVIVGRPEYDEDGNLAYRVRPYDAPAKRTPAELVHEFHKAFALASGQAPTEALRILRARLVEEEMAEAGDAAAAALLGGDLAAVAKELADAAYVLYGAADTFSIDLDAAIVAVHESNMSKLGADGQPILREDGKVLKGPNYKEADVSGALSKGTNYWVQADSAARGTWDRDFPRQPDAALVDNVVAAVLIEHYGYLPPSIRYGAAEAARAVIEAGRTTGVHEQQYVRLQQQADMALHGALSCCDKYTGECDGKAVAEMWKWAQ
jgi:predicted HAD superfamily Cof-like phosphohydrolase